MSKRPHGHSGALVRWSNSACNQKLEDSSRTSGSKWATVGSKVSWCNHTPEVWFLWTLRLYSGPVYGKVAMIAFSSQEEMFRCATISTSDRNSKNGDRVVPIASNLILGSSKWASSLWRLWLRKSLCQHAKQLHLRIRDLTFRFFSPPLTTFPYDPCPKRSRSTPRSRRINALWVTPRLVSVPLECWT